MLNGAPKWKFVAWVSKPRFGSTLILVNEAETFKVFAMRPNVLVPHERKLRDGKPVSGWNVTSVIHSIRNHNRTGGTNYMSHFYVRTSPLVRRFSYYSQLQKCQYSPIGPGLSRAVSFIKLSRYGISWFIEPKGKSLYSRASCLSL